ncbi:MAG: glutaredoxin domain-containing protein [Candidatus Andersenbacteria bacterium]
MANVTIYTTSTCGYCKAAKEYMQANNVKYTEINVGIDAQKAREMIEKSGQMGVPVMVVENEGNEDVIIGFDQSRMAKVFGLAA